MANEITPMAFNRMSSAQDAMGRYACAKFPTIDSSVNNVHQILVNNAAITQNQDNIISKSMGNPTTVRVFITVSGACNFQVLLANTANPTKFYHDSSLDISISAPGDKVVDVKGAGIVKLIPSAGVTATIEVLALY